MSKRDSPQETFKMHIDKRGQNETKGLSLTIKVQIRKEERKKIRSKERRSWKLSMGIETTETAAKRQT